jgi:plastocyanin
MVQAARVRGGIRFVKRILAALSLAFLLGLLAQACGGGSELGPPTPGPGGETVIRIEMRNSSFSPSALTVRAGKDYLLELRNDDRKAHDMRIAGIDNEYETEDDIVSESVDPGKTGSLEFRIDEPGIFDFRSDSDPISMIGTLTVWEPPPIATWVPPTPSPTPSPTEEVESPTPAPAEELESPTPAPAEQAESPTPASTPAGE